MGGRRRLLALGVSGLVASLSGCLADQAWELNTIALTQPVSPVAATVPNAPTGGDSLPAPDAVRTGLIVGLAQEKAGNDRAAAVQYEKVLELEPTNLPATRRLAVVCDKLGEFTRSEDYYKKAARALPRDADLECDWGYSQYLRNNWEEAAKHYQRAIVLDPKHQRARCNMGMALGRMDRFEQAYQAFLDGGLSEAEAHCDLAFVYITKGKMDEAKQELQTARKKDPGCAKAQELLAKLEAPPKPRPDHPATKEEKLAQIRETAKKEALMAGTASSVGGDPAVKPVAAPAVPSVPPGADLATGGLPSPAPRPLAVVPSVDRGGRPSAHPPEPAGPTTVLKPITASELPPIPASGQPVYTSPNGTQWMAKPRPTTPATPPVGNPGNVTID